MLKCVLIQYKKAASGWIEDTANDPWRSRQQSGALHRPSAVVAREPYNKQLLPLLHQDFPSNRVLYLKSWEMSEITLDYRQLSILHIFHPHNTPSHSFTEKLQCCSFNSRFALAEQLPCVWFYAYSYHAQSLFYVLMSWKLRKLHAFQQLHSPFPD